MPDISKSFIYKLITGKRGIPPIIVLSIVVWIILIITPFFYALSTNWTFLCFDFHNGQSCTFIEYMKIDYWLWFIFTPFISMFLVFIITGIGWLSRQFMR